MHGSSSELVIYYFSCSSLETHLEQPTRSAISCFMELLNRIVTCLCITDHSSFSLVLVVHHLLVLSIS